MSTDTTPTQKNYTNLHVDPKEHSEIEISAEIPVDVVHSYRTKAIKKIVGDLELPGFRKGHVPEDMAVQHVGETAIMQETAEQALSAVYPQIVVDEKLDVVGRPQVTITKLAPGNPIGFKITTAVYPEVILPDYAKIAEKTRKGEERPDEVEVSDADVDAELARLQEMMTPRESETSNDESSNETGEQGSGLVDPSGNPIGSEKNTEEKQAPQPPEINDAFARQLGDFKDLADLKEKIKKGMRMEKQQKAAEKRRLAIADAVIAKTKLEVPGVFVEGELDQMMASFEDRVTRAGMKIDEYLEQTQKTKEELRKEWRSDAEKRAKLQIILAEIAKKEELSPDAERLEREVKHVKEHYPDAEEHAVRSYVGAQMLNEKVFALLEGKDPNETPKEESHEQEDE